MLYNASGKFSVKKEGKAAGKKMFLNITVPNFSWQQMNSQGLCNYKEDGIFFIFPNSHSGY